MKLYHYILFAILVVTMVVIIFFTPVDFSNPDISTFGSETVRARVKEIIDEDAIDLGNVTQRYQIARVEILDGDYQGLVMEMDYGKRQIL